MGKAMLIPDMSDDEMYKKTEFLANDDETFGCYIKGHQDLEQFERVAREFLKKECNMRDNEEIEVKQGYYKVVPWRKDEGFIFYFSTTQQRGAMAITEARFD